MNDSHSLFLASILLAIGGGMIGYYVYQTDELHDTDDNRSTYSSDTDDNSNDNSDDNSDDNSEDEDEYYTKKVLKKKQINKKDVKNKSNKHTK